MSQYKTNQKALINTICASSVDLLSFLNQFLKLNRIHNSNELLQAFEDTLI